jgi:hypothetical protein
MGRDDKGRNVVIHHLGGAKEQPARISGKGDPRREGRADQAGMRPDETAEPAPTTDYD